MDYINAEYKGVDSFEVKGDQSTKILVGDYVYPQMPGYVRKDLRVLAVETSGTGEDIKTEVTVDGLIVNNIIGVYYGLVDVPKMHIKRKVASKTIAIPEDNSVAMGIVVPENSMIIAVLLNVDEALGEGETWDAALSGGDTTSIGTENAVDQDTKLNMMFENPPVTSDDTDITISRNSGDFSDAGGKITGVIIYEEVSELPNRGSE